MITEKTVVQVLCIHNAFDVSAFFIKVGGSAREFYYVRDYASIDAARSAAMQAALGIVNEIDDDVETESMIDKLVFKLIDHLHGFVGLFTNHRFVS